MAYNVLKGNVQFINSDSGSIESMVDDYSNQTIAGVKTFSSPVTASAFYNSSGGGSPIVSSPINTLYGAGEDRVAIFSGSNELTASTGLTYDGTVLVVTGNISSSINISGSGFYGSAIGLTNLPAASITGQVSAANINIGDGLRNNSGVLAVSGSDASMTIAATGISVNTGGSTTGIKVGGSGIRVAPDRAGAIGSLSSGDEFLVADVDDSNDLKKATITKLQTYMDNTLSFAKVAGSDEQIFFNNGGSNTLGTDTTFTFNDTTKVVSVTGISASLNISASAFYGNGASLTSISATALNGNVSAGNINIGNGLFNDSNALAVSASYGLKATSQGLEVTASATSGLNALSTTGLIISPSRTTAKASPVVGDIILLGDSGDSNNVKNATLTSVITLVKNNGAGGANTQVQFNNSNAFGGSSNFIFNSATNTLSVSNVSSSLGITGSRFLGGIFEGSGFETPTTFINSTHLSSSLNISGSAFYGDGSNLTNVGGSSAYNSFTADYTVATTHDLMGIVTTGSAITASLPTAATFNAGQRFTFKDVSGSCSGSNHIVISASFHHTGNRIDGQGIIKIEAGYGALTLASDGVNNYYIVSTS